MDEAKIHQALTRSLIGGRIAPGTKLGEQRLAEFFGVSRERIRKVLHRLGHERLIRIEKNRGAFAIEPDLGEARAIYEARRIVEAGIAAHLAGTLDAAGRARLDAHMTAEAQALEDGDRVASIRLSAEFHTILAELTGNVIVIRQMQELVARTVMLVAHCEPGSATACQCREHRAIHRAVLAGDPAKSVRAMTTHLSLVETRLRPRLCDAVDEPMEDALLTAAGESLRGRVPAARRAGSRQAPAR